MSDLAVALAFLARREARTAMSAARWAHLLSFGLGWMNPGQARSFVGRAVAAGLLAEDGEQLRLVIDPAAVEVPRGFRPDPLADGGQGSAPAAPAGAPKDAAGATPAAAAPAPDPFLAWVARLAAHHGTTREHVLGRVASVQERMGGHLTADAAVLWLAREAGMEVAQAARDAGSALRPRAAAPAAPAPAGTP